MIKGVFQDGILQHWAFLVQFLVRISYFIFFQRLSGTDNLSCIWVETAVISIFCSVGTALNRMYFKSAERNHLFFRF